MRAAFDACSAGMLALHASLQAPTPLDYARLLACHTFMQVARGRLARLVNISQRLPHCQAGSEHGLVAPICACCTCKFHRAIA